MNKKELYNVIEHEICKKYETSHESIAVKDRQREKCFVRQLVMYYGRKYKVGSLQYVAAKYGRDHATALHAIKTINDLIDTDKEIREDVDNFDKKFDDIVENIASESDQHKNKHIKMHNSLNILLCEFRRGFSYTGSFFDLTIGQLKKWSYSQTINPD